MAVPVLAAAKWLGQRSGWSLSNLELQKLIYIAHMLHLGRVRQPLIAEHFEAWAYGPVAPALYHWVKIFGSAPVQNVFHAVGDPAEGTEVANLVEAYTHLSDAPPGRLVAITHWDKGAWAKHYVPGIRGTVIPNSDILQEYRDRENVAQSAPA